MEGVHINLISRKKLESMGRTEKIRYILDEVKKNHILVLEEGLAPDEEFKLIEHAMLEIEPDGFSGVEFESQREALEKTMLAKIFKRSTYAGRASMTVVGPANALQTVHKDGDVIEAMVVNGPTATAGAS